MGSFKPSTPRFQGTQALGSMEPKHGFLQTQHAWVPLKALGSLGPRRWVLWNPSVGLDGTQAWVASNPACLGSLEPKCRFFGTQRLGSLMEPKRGFRRTQHAWIRWNLGAGSSVPLF
ncbi:hypothetical protein SLEP1_g8057 [Rubroshorea leprosula]|uniref:Uncharacterized protein n=1 Tax=Rubroshorea leprosula TaxID=152421 RepID=A0AAV5I9H3_9ROSI|nr:hypothetical protein SLEP1_g8057 [Rubroshorea leprosula]